MKYKVYEINSENYYSGNSLIAARNAEEANKMIREFKNDDAENKMNSAGYQLVKESDCIEHLFSDISGFITKDIFFSYY